MDRLAFWPVIPAYPLRIGETMALLYMKRNAAASVQGSAPDKLFYPKISDAKGCLSALFQRFSFQPTCLS
jgi:hypothetical protein